MVRLEPKPTSAWRSLFSICTYFGLWFFNLAFVSGGLLFMSEHRTWQNVLTKTVTTKFAQRHNRNDFCNIFRWTQFLKFKQKKCYSFSFFSCSFRGTHSYVLFYFRFGHIFCICNSKLKTFLFFSSSFRWTHPYVLFYFRFGHIFYICNSKLKTFLFFSSSFRWTNESPRRL